jgi:hypothetical protein
MIQDREDTSTGIVISTRAATPFLYMNPARRGCLDSRAPWVKCGLGWMRVNQLVNGSHRKFKINGVAGKGGTGVAGRGIRDELGLQP